MYPKKVDQPGKENKIT